MFTRSAVALAGLCLVTSASGCCGLGGFWGYGNRCAPCNNGCSPMGSYQGGYQRGAVFEGMDASQSAYLMSPTVPATALAPLQPLPTFN